MKTLGRWGVIKLMKTMGYNSGLLDEVSTDYFLIKYFLVEKDALYMLAIIYVVACMIASFFFFYKKKITYFISNIRIG